MAREHKRYKKPWDNASQPKDPEKDLADEICKTGRVQIRKRTKAGFSAFYVRNGKLVEAKPDKTEVEKANISDEWLTVAPEKRFFILE